MSEDDPIGWQNGDSDNFACRWRKFGPFALQVICAETVDGTVTESARWEIIDLDTGDEIESDEVVGTPSIAKLQTIGLDAALAWVDSLRDALSEEPTTRTRKRQR